MNESDIRKKLIERVKRETRAHTPAHLIREVKRNLYKITEEILSEKELEGRKRENIARPERSKIRKTLEMGDSATWNDASFALLVRQLEENVQKSMYGNIKGEDWRLMVPLLLGPGGTGKSAIAKEAIKYVGFAYGIDYKIHTMDMGTMNTYDFSGALSVQSKTAGELRSFISRTESEINEIKRKIEELKNLKKPNEKELGFFLSELKEKETEYERGLELLEAIAARNGYDDVEEVPDTADISQHTKTTPEFSIKILSAYTRNKKRQKLNAEYAKENEKIEEYNAAFNEIDLPAPLDNSLVSEDFESNRNIEAYNKMVEEYNEKAEKENLPKAKKIPYKQERMALFLDEITRTDPDNFNIFMVLLQQGILPGTEFRIPEGTLIVAAGNQMEGNANVTIDISSDKAGHDRFMVIPMFPNVEYFLEMGRYRGFHPVVLSYVEANPDKLLVTDLEDNELIADRYEEKFMVSPKSLNPRTWEMISDILHEADTVITAVRNSKASDTMKKEAEMKYRNHMRRRLSELIADVTVLDELVKQYEDISEITYTSFMMKYVPKIKEVVEKTLKGNVVEASKAFEGLSKEIRGRLDAAASPNIASAIVTEMIKRLPSDLKELERTEEYENESDYHKAVKDRLTPEVVYLSAVSMGLSATENIRRILEYAERGSSLGTNKTTYMERAGDAVKRYFQNPPGYLRNISEYTVDVIADAYGNSIAENLEEKGFSPTTISIMVDKNTNSMKKNILSAIRGNGSKESIGKNMFEFVIGSVSGQTIAMDEYASAMKKGKSIGSVKGKLSRLKKMKDKNKGVSDAGGDPNL